MKELFSVKAELFQTSSDPPRMRAEAAPKSTLKKAEAVDNTKEETKWEPRSTQVVQNSLKKATTHYSGTLPETAPNPYFF